MPRLVTLVAYYPTTIPSPKQKYPPHFELMVHLAASQSFAPVFKHYTYPDTELGFAEHDLNDFDKIAAGVAWSRSLGAVRKGSRTTSTLRRPGSSMLRLNLQPKMLLLLWQPWLTSHVPPTSKEVSVALVSVVCIRGGKLYHEHLYWDQASVLVQVGLLNPKLVPKDMAKKGLKRLSVYGVETQGTR